MSTPAREVSEREIRLVAERLGRAYPYMHAHKAAEGVFTDAPLDALIRAILSQNTTDIGRDIAFTALRRRFPTWDALADAPIDIVAETIRATNHAPTKAERMIQILQAIRAEVGSPITLAFLRDWPTERILGYLQSFTGVGPKSAAVVALFALGRPVMPVDTHVYRVTQRLGWVRPAIGAERAHRVLRDLIPDDLMLALHIGLWEHGHTTCRPVPRCARCAIYACCRYSAKTAPMPDVEVAIAITAGRFQAA